MTQLGNAALSLLSMWCAAALLLGGGDGTVGPVRLAALGLWVGGVVGILWRAPRRWRLAGWGAACAAVVGWFAWLPAANERDWNPDQRVTSWVDVDGPRLTVHRIRNFRYTDATTWTEDWYDATFDLDTLERGWFAVERFGTFEGLAHTLVSFEFRGGRFLAVSVEIRKERGETFSPLRGLFKQYELMYVVADERDVIQLRTNHRGDDVYLHPIAAGPERTRAYLLDVVQRVNALHARPAFYNTATASCTTALADHLRAVAGREIRLDWRVLLPGFSDRLAYDQGLIDTDLGWDETRARNHINARALEAAGAEDFSERIRAITAP